MRSKYISAMANTDRARCAGAGSRKQVVLECGPFFCFHHVNAFEDASGNVTLDCIAMHGGVDFSMNFSNLSHEFFAKQPWRTSLTRLSLNPTTAAVRAPVISMCGASSALHLPCKILEAAAQALLQLLCCDSNRTLCIGGSVS